MRLSIEAKELLKQKYHEFFSSDDRKLLIKKNVNDFLRDVFYRYNSVREVWKFVLALENLFPKNIIDQLRKIGYPDGNDLPMIGDIYLSEKFDKYTAMKKTSGNLIEDPPPVHLLIIPKFDSICKENCSIQVTIKSSKIKYEMGELVTGITLSPPPKVLERSKANMSCNQKDI